MIKQTFLTYIALLSVSSIMFFGFTRQDVVKPDKPTLQKQLENEFVAPCCFREAVATHRSGASLEVRDKIEEPILERVSSLGRANGGRKSVKSVL